MTIATQHASDRAAMVRAAARGGVVGPFLFAAVVLVAGWQYGGYSHVRQKISELGGAGSEVALLQNINFLVFGILVLGFAWALGHHLGAPLLGPALLGVFGGASGLLQGVLPCDAGCAGSTPVGLAHNVTGLVGFLAALGGMVVLARRWRTDPRWSRHVTPTVVAVVVALAGLAWFVFTQATGDVHHVGGVAQRTFVVALLAWIARTAWLLDRQLAVADRGA